MTLPEFPLQVLLAGCAAYVFALLATPWVRRLAMVTGCISRPKEDRWGRRFVPRLGGLAISIGFLGATAWAAQQDPRMTGLLLGGVLITAAGMVDDFRRMHPTTKLVAQILTGCIVVLYGVRVDMPFSFSWLSIPLTIGWLVLVMNAFNLMDNMDGLSAGIGAIAGSFCTLHALYTGQPLVAMVALGLTGATLGFLHYNLPPAKIFMGDTGSQVLGLGLGALALMETWHQPARLLGILSLPTLLLAVPIFDTFFVMIQRLLHGRHPFQGGTDHLSHRLGFLGLSPRQVVFMLYSLTTAFGILSLIPITGEPLAIIGIWLGAAGILLLLGATLAKVRVYTGPAAPPQEGKVTLVETMLMHKRRIVEMAVDFAFICACYVMAHALRFEATFTPDIEALLLQSLPWVIAVKMLCFFSFGLYRGVWRYISLPDLANILKAVLAGSVLSALAVLYLWRFEGYSRAVFIIDGTLLFLAISGARLVEPMLNEWINAAVQRTTQVLIIGAGDTGELLLQQLKLEQEGTRRVIGFLDDDRSKKGNSIHGLPILGTRHDLGRIVQAYRVQEIFIALRRPPEDLVRQIQGYCEENGLLWRIVPSLALNEPAPRFKA